MSNFDESITTSAVSTAPRSRAGRRMIAALAAGGLFLAACGSDGSDAAEEDTSAETSETTNNITTVTMDSHIFFTEKVLHLSDNMNEVGGIPWRMWLSFTVAWLLIFGIIYKGIESSGKVVYFTVPAPVPLPGRNFRATPPQFHFHYHPPVLPRLPFRTWCYSSWSSAAAHYRALPKGSNFTSCPTFRSSGMGGSGRRRESRSSTLWALAGAR